jgi:hypothetical protein
MGKVQTTSDLAKHSKCLEIAPFGLNALTGSSEAHTLTVQIGQNSGIDVSFCVVLCIVGGKSFGKP